MKKRILSFVLAIVLILVLVPGAFATSNPWSSNDAPSSWAQSYVREAYNQNLVPSNLMGRFTQSITRAEFTHLAVALYEELTGRTITGRVTFTDTDDVNVQKMAYLGVVRGVGNNRFNPDGLITREESAAMLVRLANATDVTIPDYSNYTFADHDRVSSWAVGYVRQMRLSGIMGGVGNNRFDPRGSYTREQSIVTIMRLLNELDEVVSGDTASLPASISPIGLWSIQDDTAAGWFIGGETFEFFENGSGIERLHEDFWGFNWSVQGSVLTMVYNHQTLVYNLEIIEGRLHLTSDGDTMVFTPLSVPISLIG